MTAGAVIKPNVLQGLAVTALTAEETPTFFAVQGIPPNRIHFYVWLSFKVEELSAVIGCANLSAVGFENGIVTMIFIGLVSGYVVSALVHDDIFDTLVSTSFQ